MSCNDTSFLGVIQLHIKSYPMYTPRRRAGSLARATRTNESHSFFHGGNRDGHLKNINPLKNSDSKMTRGDASTFYSGRPPVDPKIASPRLASITLISFFNVNVITCFAL